MYFFDVRDDALLDRLANRLANLSDADEDSSMENCWCQLRNTVHSNTLNILGHTSRQHHEGFGNNDAGIHTLLAEKNRLHKAYVDHPTDATIANFYRSHYLVQQRLREMQGTWMICKVEEIQGYVDHKEWKKFFAEMKAVYGPHVKGAAILLSADGTTLLTERTQILKYSAEHFRSILNRPSTISDFAINRMPQVENKAGPDHLLSLQETIRAVQ
ncbi:unnamed protein product [Schistocephalus solidus]|uniref:Robl_LC7 domain-containing protein n=1 Tax=Schistocephalus solidus TaxID=70667 RepID=A0A183T6M6_SCHSO|nr:unnamed protein product [Schistocephalus solidus]